MTDKKKKTAVIAAVAHYIQTGEAAMAAQAAVFPPAEPAAKGPAPMILNLWGISGRHQQMQMRGMMQMKSFHGSRSKF